MSALPAFRNRRNLRRTEYSPLDNTDSETDSIQRRSPPSRRSSGSSLGSPILCDKCWLRQERTSATKRCLECKQNLCETCASRDKTKRPWWLPCWIVHCWRFLFSKADIPHSIVDLPPSNRQQAHWAHTQEASSIQRIPRVQRSSIRSNNGWSGGSGGSNGHHASNEYLLRVDLDAPKQRRFGSMSSDSGWNRHEHKIPTKPPRQFHHSHSYEGKSRRAGRASGLPYRRTKSTEGLAHMYKKEELERIEQYNKNWEIGVAAEENDTDKNNERYINHRRRLSNKMKGKDIDIEFTDKDIKLIVNEEENTKSKSKIANKSGAAKTKRKISGDDPKPYTEKLFQDVPIWFKKQSKTAKNNENMKGKRSSLDRNKTKDTKAIYDNGAFVKDSAPFKHHNRTEPSEFSPRQQTSYSRRYSDHQTSRTPYIVEEPPDNCPICLEELPGNEARTLTCCHVIHTCCLIKYLKGTDLDFGIMCPLCHSTTIIKNYYAPRELWYKELPLSSTV